MRSFGLDVVDDPVADPDRALGRVLEPGDHPQRGGLAAARRAEQHEELPVVDLEREVVDGDDVAEALRHVFEHDPGHERELERRARTAVTDGLAALSRGGTSLGDPSRRSAAISSAVGAGSSSTVVGDGERPAARGPGALDPLGERLGARRAPRTSSSSPSGVGFSSRPRSVTSARTARPGDVT